jgi:hypothetical protein
LNLRRVYAWMMHPLLHAEPIASASCFAALKFDDDQ